MIRRRASSMVRLKNLKKNNNIGECDIFPEDSSQPGHIGVDLKTGDLREYSLPIGYEWCVNHAYHAGKRLTELLHKEEVPEEYLTMWN